MEKSHTRLEMDNRYEREKNKLSSIWKSGSVATHYCEQCGKFIIDKNELDI